MSKSISRRRALKNGACTAASASLVGASGIRLIGTAEDPDRALRFNYECLSVASCVESAVYEREVLPAEEQFFESRRNGDRRTCKALRLAAGLIAAERKNAALFRTAQTFRGRVASCTPQTLAGVACVLRAAFFMEAGSEAAGGDDDNQERAVDAAVAFLERGRAD